MFQLLIERWLSFKVFIGLLSVLFALWALPALAQTPPYIPPGGERLRDLATRRGILSGGTSSWLSVYDPPQANSFKAEFNVMTPDNNLKWNCIHPQPTVYNWNNSSTNPQCSSADDDVAFAQSNGINVHGHTLVYHESLPAWVTNTTQTPVTQRLNVLLNHIGTVVSHYRGRVQIWDVVNEAIDCEGKPCQYRNTIWYQTTNGFSYIVQAFKRAHQADPTAILLYNDFWLGEGNPKSTFLYEEIQKWKTAGAPINGVGFQMHIDINFGQGQNIGQFQAFSDDLQRFANLGLDVYITELDVTAYDPSLFNVQANIYRELLQRCLMQPHCKGFQTWGMTDRYSWLNDPTKVGPNADPLLFDDNFTPKPAYYAVQEALRSVQLEAENANTQSGVIVYPGAMIGNVEEGDWLRFNNVDLGNGYASFRTRYSKGNTDNSWVEIRLGSLTGKKIAELHLDYTGGWDYPKYLVEKSTLLSGVTGKQTLFVLFHGGGVGNFDWFRFENDLSQPLEVENRTAGSGVEPVNATGSTIVYNVQDGAWLRFNNVDLRSGYATLRVRYAKGNDIPVVVEVHQSSRTGTLLATLTTQNTGGWDTYKEFTTPVTGGVGVKTLFFVFRGGGVNVDSFRLESEDAVIYVAPSGSGTVNGIDYDNRDILAYYLSTGEWRQYFDGSDVVTSNTKIDALDVQRDGRILLSFDLPVTLGGRLYDDSDLLRFTPTTVGEVTAGTFSMYLDASDVGLTTDSEDVDAVALNPSNYPLISTVGVVDAPNMIGEDEDIARFRTTTLGNNTAGVWSTYMNGSDIGLTTNNEDVDGVWMDPDGNDARPSNIYLGTLGAFALTDGVRGDGNDIFACNPVILGATTSCLNRFFRDMGAAGLGTVAMGDFSISTTPRSLDGSSTLVAVSASSIEPIDNIAPPDDYAEDDPAAQLFEDDTPRDQSYPDDITSEDMPTAIENDISSSNQIFLPFVSR